MLVLGLRLSRFMGQGKIGGADRKTNLCCASCYFYNCYQRASKGYSTKDASGWCNHTRSTCSWRSSCPILADEEMLKMSDAELRRQLRLNCLFGPEEQRNEEQREAEKNARARPARSVSMSDEPERSKRRKKLKQRKEKRRNRKRKRWKTHGPNFNPNRILPCVVISLTRRLDARLKGAS